MPREKNAPGTTSPKAPSFNSLVAQLETPRSFLNLIPTTLKTAILDLPEELLSLNEEQFEKLIIEKTSEVIPTTVDALRNNFWLEYTRVCATKNELMNIGNIYQGVCGMAHFNNIYQTKPYFLAYIITKPPEYEAVMGGLLSLSTRRIRDFLNIPMKKPNGDYQDAKTLELILKAAAMVDLRSRGNYLNRSETKNLTIMNSKTEVSNTYAGVFQGAANMNASQLVENIDGELKRLEQELKEQGITMDPATPNFSKPENHGATDPVVLDAEVVDEEKY